MSDTAQEYALTTELANEVLSDAGSETESQPDMFV